MNNLSQFAEISGIRVNPPPPLKPQKSGEPPQAFKPRKNPVTYAEGLAWSGDAHRITRKYDGEFVGGFRCVVAGVPIIGNAERMTPKAGARWTEGDKAESGKRKAENGEFFVLTDVSHLDGTDVSRWTLRQRWAEVRRLFASFPLSAFRFPLLLPDEYADGSALARVIEQGGEGICAHGWDAPFGADFYAAKHLETFLCTVTGFVEGTQSVEIAEVRGQRSEVSTDLRSPISDLCPRGRVPLRGNKLDHVRVGSIIKVEGMGLTPAGRIREPRVCQDSPTSWLVKW